MALALSVAALILRDSMADARGDRLMLVLFVPPIILSAVLGGLGPGLLTSVTSILLVAVVVVPPSWSVKFPEGNDLLQCATLLLSGIVVSVLSEALLRSRRKLARAVETQTGDVARLAAIIESSEDAIIGKGLDGRITNWNPAAERLFGYSAAEVADWNESRLLPEGDRDKERERVAKILQGERVPQFETRLLRKDGSDVDVAVSLSPIRDGEGRVVGVSKIARDITERKLYEAAILAARHAAEAASRSKSEFLANMSHEIRTPMNSIIGLTQLVLESELTARQRDYLRKVRTSSQALLGIINDILDYSKIEAGRLEIEHVPFDLEQVLSGVSDLFLTGIEEKGLELFIEITPQTPTALIGDPLRLGQILNNLVGNAIKFTERGHVHLRVDAAERTEYETVLRVEVRDTGIGLSKEEADRLFRPFSQADTSITRRYGGSGLGLTISRHLVELMNGAIGVSGAPGKGCCFTFTVRLGVAQEQPASKAEGLAGMRTLIADDQDTSLIILRRMLEAWHGEVVTLPGGAHVMEAVENAEALGHPFDLVLLDWQMPDLSGLDVARKIEGATVDRRLDRPPTVIMVTAHNRDRLMAEAGDTHIDGILLKPVTPSSLHDAICRVRTPSATAVKPEKSDSSPYELARPIQGARILVVEDNPLNRDVALGILGAAGFDVTMACDGAEAVALVEERDFDAVLMDVHMPGMDGLEATMRIRQMGKTLPIIAMTAAAMADDRKACLEIGMDDHVSKPVVTRDLLTTLAAWIKPGNRPPPPKDVVIPAGQAGFPDIPGIDSKDASRRLEGDCELFESLLTGAARQFTGAVAQIRFDWDEHGVEAAARRLHTLRGVAGNVSATVVADRAGRAEKALLSGSNQEATDLLVDLDVALAEVIDGLARHAARRDEAKPKAGQPVLLDAKELSALMAALASGKGDALTRFEALRGGIEAVHGTEATARIAAAVEDLRFGEALAMLSGQGE